MSSRPRQLTPTEAYEELQRIVPRYGVSWRRHVLDRGAERNYFADDVLRVLATGVVSASAEWSDEYKNWKYSVAGRDYDGNPLIVIVAIDPGYDRVTVITAHGD